MSKFRNLKVKKTFLSKRLKSLLKADLCKESKSFCCKTELFCTFIYTIHKGNLPKAFSRPGASKQLLAFNGRVLVSVPRKQSTFADFRELPKGELCDFWN